MGKEAGTSRQLREFWATLAVQRTINYQKAKKALKDQAVITGTIGGMASRHQTLRLPRNKSKRSHSGGAAQEQKIATTLGVAESGYKEKKMLNIIALKKKGTETRLLEDRVR